MRYGKNVKPCEEFYVMDLYDTNIVERFLQPLVARKITLAEGIQANMERWNEVIENQNNAMNVLKAK